MGSFWRIFFALSHGLSPDCVEGQEWYKKSAVAERDAKIGIQKTVFGPAKIQRPGYFADSGFMLKRYMPLITPMNNFCGSRHLVFFRALWNFEIIWISRHFLNSTITGTDSASGMTAWERAWNFASNDVSMTENAWRISVWQPISPKHPNHDWFFK